MAYNKRKGEYKLEPRPWIVDVLLNPDSLLPLDEWFTEFRFLVVNGSVSSRYWDIIDTPKGERQHYVIMASDTRCAIKTLFPVNLFRKPPKPGDAEAKCPPTTSANANAECSMEEDDEDSDLPPLSLPLDGSDDQRHWRLRADGRPPKKFDFCLTKYKFLLEFDETDEPFLTLVVGEGCIPRTFHYDRHIDGFASLCTDNTRLQQLLRNHYGNDRVNRIPRRAESSVKADDAADIEIDLNQSTDNDTKEQRFVSPPLVGNSQPSSATRQEKRNDVVDDEAAMLLNDYITVRHMGVQTNNKRTRWTKTVTNDTNSAIAAEVKAAIDIASNWTSLQSQQQDSASQTGIGENSQDQESAQTSFNVSSDSCSAPKRNGRGIEFVLGDDLRQECLQILLSLRDD